MTERELIRRAAEQSGDLAEARLARLPTRPRPAKRGVLGRRGAWLPALGAATLSCLVLVGTGVTWALIHEDPSVAPTTERVLPLGEALREQARVAGPRPVSRSHENVEPARARAVREQAPRRVRHPVTNRSVKPLDSQAVKVAAKKTAPPKGERGRIVFDQPQGDVIIVSPKSKQGPLWTPKDFGKYMRMRSRSLSF